MIEAIVLQVQQGNSFISIAFMVAILLVVYLFMIRPQQKKINEQKKFIEKVKKGDRIVTVGGMHGRIVEIDQETCMLEIEKGGRIKLNKTAISMELSKATSSQK